MYLYITTVRRDDNPEVPETLTTLSLWKLSYVVLAVVVLLNPRPSQPRAFPGGTLVVVVRFGLKPFRLYIFSQKCDIERKIREYSELPLSPLSLLQIALNGKEKYRQFVCIFQNVYDVLDSSFFVLPGATVYLPEVEPISTLTGLQAFIATQPMYLEVRCNMFPLGRTECLRPSRARTG